MILSLFLNFKFHQCLNQKCLMLLYCIIKNIIGVFSIIFFLYSIQRWFVDGLYKFSMYGSVAWGRQVGGFNSSFLALVKFLEKHAPWQWNICLSLVIRMQALKRREIRAIDSKISEPYILSSMKIELTLSNAIIRAYRNCDSPTFHPTNFHELKVSKWRWHVGWEDNTSFNSQTEGKVDYLDFFLEKRVILSLSKNSGEITPSGKLVQINSVVLIC